MMGFCSKKPGLWAAPLTLALGLFVDATAFAQGNSVIVGTVRDAASKAPIANVVVTITSPSLQGEQILVTDPAGHYRASQLPPGDYTIRLEKESYKLSAQDNITVHLGHTIRVNIDLLPQTLTTRELYVKEAAALDMGSVQLGTVVDSNFADRISLLSPFSKGAVTRSFEAFASIAPSVQPDLYGMSMSGATSPENQYFIDGLSVNNPASGVLSSPLSIEFIKEINVITGGYMPEYGRSTGGVIDALTKSGSNEFHGSIFASISPGILEGERAVVPRAGQTILVDAKELSLRDVGFEFGGPILKDKLWFFMGFSPSTSRQTLERYLNHKNFRQGTCINPNFDPMDPSSGPETVACNIPRTDASTGLTLFEEIQRTRKSLYVQEENFQYIGKLTYLLSSNQSMALSVSGVHTSAGGKGIYPDIPISFNGTYESLATRNRSANTNLAFTWSSSWMKRRLLLDAMLGWSNVSASHLPVDGSSLGSNDGLAGLAKVVWRRSLGVQGSRNISEFENSPEIAAACAPVPVFIDPAINPSRMENPCPLAEYSTGGPGYIDDQSLDRYQAKAAATYLLRALGHHVLKAGADLEFLRFDHLKAFTGTTIFRESASGRTWQDFRRYGFLTGPDEAVVLNALDTHSFSASLGGFIQDSWSIMDKIILNMGLRYDAQAIIGDDGKVGLSLPNQWSPRVGVIYDFTQAGHSRLFAHYARYYEQIPLDMADRAFPGDHQIRSSRFATNCDPSTNEGQESSGCTLQDENGNPDYSNAVHVGGTFEPNQFWQVTYANKSAVDPDIQPQSVDELVAGAEYEVFSNGWAGLQYTKRWMNAVIEDMSRVDGGTYFIGNPGQGIARDFPAATRDHDALTLYFTKNFSNKWLAQASYTLSYTRGNYAGLFRSETGQLDPNISSDFDLISLLVNRTGPLPIDHTHQIKLFGAKDFSLGKWLDLNAGLGFRSQSGAPISVLGGHLFYGANEAFVIPRGAYGRTPWVHSIDTNIGVSIHFSKDSQLQLGMSVFNLLNFQAVTAVDQTLTYEPVAPILNGTPADLPKKNPTTHRFECPDTGGSSLCAPGFETAINPNWNNPTAYQAPRQFRFNAKVTF